MEQNQSGVPFMVEVVQQNQSGFVFMIKKTEQQLSIGDKIHCQEKSSNSETCNEHSEEQEKDKVSKANVEDAAFCRKESLNCRENVESIVMKGIKQEPVDDVHHTEKASVGGNEEKNKEQVNVDFEMEIKPQIIDFLPQKSQQKFNPRNNSKSRKRRFKEEGDDLKKNIKKRIVNIVRKCPTCPEVFSSTVLKKQHKCSTPYKCHICEKVLKSEAKLCSHMSCHIMQTCPVCGKSFQDKKYYLLHLKVHSGVAYKCLDCDRVFTSSTLYNIHCRKHTGEQPYICEFCGKTFVLTQSYQAHLKEHSGGRRFECHTCLKRFPLKTTLHNHIRFHTGERPYVCEVCGNCFRDTRGLWRHTKNAHEKKFKSYECNICGRKFLFEKCFTKHVKSHEGESFNCPVCNRAFISSSSRDRHEKTHKKKTSYDCATCYKAYSARRNLEKHIFKFQH